MNCFTCTDILYGLIGTTLSTGQEPISRQSQYCHPQKTVFVYIHSFAVNRIKLHHDWFFKKEMHFYPLEFDLNM